VCVCGKAFLKPFSKVPQVSDDMMIVKIFGGCFPLQWNLLHCPTLKKVVLKNEFQRRKNKNWKLALS